MHRERQQHAAVKKRWKGMFARHKSDCGGRLLLFRPFWADSRAPYLSNTSGDEREVRHVFKDTGLVFWENRVRPAAQEDPRSLALLYRGNAARQSILVSSRNSADTSADRRTLSVRLVETACNWKEDSL